MESFPDLASLSDEDLKAMIRDLESQDHRVSYDRRMIQGRIDLLRAELVDRLQRGKGGPDEPPNDPGGVREPRRPRPAGGAAAASLDEP